MIPATELVDGLAELAVEVGANVQPGQIVTVAAEVGQEELVRAIAERSYRRGASFVDVSYFDPYVKRARIESADPDTLAFMPAWYGRRVLEMAKAKCARIALAGPAAPDALKDLDPDLLGRDPLPSVPEWMRVIDDRLVNWTIVPAPSPNWARLCYPEEEETVAYAHLCAEVAHICRLDEPDPAAAWLARVQELRAVAARLDALEFDRLRFEGPGTDLTVGLLPTSTWLCGHSATVEGVEHLPNVPTEEVFTTPDPRRTEGRVRSTKPLVLVDGTIVRGLEVGFEGGLAREIDAEEGGAAVRGRARSDEGAGRLGEVALVDRESRVGQAGTVFYNTLLDENATSHVAFGDGFSDAVDPAEVSEVNRSGIHIDFMVGGEDVDVTGITRDGDAVPVLHGGTWRI